MKKRFFVALLFAPAVFVALLAVANAQVPVTTYHYDTLRTGWNSHETALTAANFPTNFGLLARITFDDQIDAQPLVVPAFIAPGVFHDVVYIATESNTVYAVDSASGGILLERNLGAPVPMPLGCLNNGPNVGINSTPVIDIAAHALYVIAYVNGSHPTYQLHALDPSNFLDEVGSPNGVTVGAIHTLTDGSTYTFDAKYARQRPALLKLNGVVYAAFGSWCDFAVNASRGWLLGWDASTPGALTPLATNELTDTRTTDPGVTPPVFLDSIWMSGAGPAGGGSDLFFSTGNSDCNFALNPVPCPSKTTNDGKTNIQESVVRLRLQNQTAPQIAGIFTPSNVLALDAADEELGSGGVLLFPTGNTTQPYLVAAAGKEGKLFLLDPQSLKTGPLDTQISDPCWCAPSFFVGADGINRIVTSQGQGGVTGISGTLNTGVVRTYQVVSSPSPHLVLEGSATIASGQQGGFFTSVSSNGSAGGSAIIWAVGRPTGQDLTNPSSAIMLYAFSAKANSDGSLTQLFSAFAGAWPSPLGDANIVPVVADGKVYVASAYLDGDNTRGQLYIFGACPSTGCIGAPVSAPIAPLAAPHAISGTVVAVSGTALTLKTRTGKTAEVDISQALANRRIGTSLRSGVPVTAQGSALTGNGALVAASVVRAKSVSASLWPPDR